MRWSAHPVSSHAFVDETKVNGLLLVAAVVAPRDLAPARTMMRGLCLPGQARLHFTKERPRRRGEIAAAICRTGAGLHIYDASAITDPKKAREACLRQLVADLAAAGAQRLVIEQDESLLKHDQTVLYAAVRAADVARSLAYEHLPARSEPLLWIADAAAWCWTHGPTWRARITPAVVSSQTL